jgi:RimJ/RimL family protein N-acetyltransferase
VPTDGSSGDGAPAAAAADPPIAPIRTPRLTLETMSIPFMRALVAHDLETAAREIAAVLPAGMPGDLEHFLQYRLAQLDGDPSIRRWLGRAMVLTDDMGARRVIGTIGFHGPPDEAGRVEVGYRVEPEFRRQGYARESITALFDWVAAEHGVKRFVASISPTNEASLGLAKAFGFRETGSHMDEIDGLELELEATWPEPEPA